MCIRDRGTGIYANVQNNASAQKIAYDATVDLDITGGSIFAAGLAGAGTGAILGTAFPIVGNIVGAVVGFVVGIGLAWFTAVSYTHLDVYKRQITTR